MDAGRFREPRSRREVLKLGGTALLGGLSIPTILAACAGGQAPTASPIATAPGVSPALSPTPTLMPLTRLRDTASGDVSYANLFVAEGAGIYERHGLQADVRLFDIGFLGAEAMVAGEADKANISSLPIIGFLDQGADLVCPAVITRADNLKLMVKREIAAPSDLEGKRIGLVTGGIAEYLLHRYLARHGVPAAAVQVLNVGVSEQVATLARGDIDGFLWGEPTLSNAREAMGDQIHLLEPNVESAASANVFVLHTRAWAEANPAAVEAGVRAMIEANQFVMEHPQETADIVAEKLSLDPADVPRLLEAGNYTWDVHLDDAAVDDLREAAEWRVSTGVIQAAPDFRRMIDPTYLRNVDPARVRLTS